MGYFDGEARLQWSETMVGRAALELLRLRLYQIH
jgi:hypothetical protein